MVKPEKPFNTAALLMVASAVLHLVVIAVAGGGYLIQMLTGAIVWAVIAAGLAQGWRWLGYVAFVLTLAGGIVAMANGMPNFGLTRAGFLGVTILDWLTAASLFAALWRDPAAKARRAPG